MMPAYLFQAHNVPPVNPAQPPPILRFMLFLPGQSGQFQKEAILGYVRQFNLGTPGLRYRFRELMATDRPVVVSEAQYAKVVSAPLQGAHPGTAPQGNRGQNQPDGPIDRSGFQTLGDGALGAANFDTLYGEANDGTYTDMYIDPAMGAVEVPRPQSAQKG